MRFMKFITVVGVLAMLSTFALGPVAAAQNAPVVKHISISKTSSTSGKEMFNTYCAVCHGLDGKGNGPATPA